MSTESGSENLAENIIDYITFVDEIHIVFDGSREGKQTKVAAIDGFDPPAYPAIKKEAERVREELYAKGESSVGPEVSVPLAIQNLLDEHDLHFTPLFIDLLKTRRIQIWPSYRLVRR